MLSDWIILLSSWAITIVGLIILMPRHRLREALVIFMFKQMITWLLGLLVAEFHLVEYPVRFFHRATTTSFTFEYFIYPAVCVIFVLRFPNAKSIFDKIAWYLFFPTWMTVVEVLLVRYTHLVVYIHWTWYLTWLTLFFTFYLSRTYYLWFFRKR